MVGHVPIGAVPTIWCGTCNRPALTCIEVEQLEAQVDQLRAAIAELREAKATKASPPIESYAEGG